MELMGTYPPFSGTLNPPNNSPDRNLNQLLTKATACLMLGNDTKRNCYKLLRISDRTLIFANITCVENNPPFRKSGERRPYNSYDELFPRAHIPDSDWERAEIDDLSKSISERLAQNSAPLLTRKPRRQITSTPEPEIKDFDSNTTDKDENWQGTGSDNDNFTDSPSDLTAHRCAIAVSDMTHEKDEFDAQTLQGVKASSSRPPQRHSSTELQRATLSISVRTPRKTNKTP